jgi:hypothetical protein
MIFDYKKNNFKIIYFKKKLNICFIFYNKIEYLIKINLIYIL